MVRFDRPLIRGDGVAYLAWVDTLVIDQDVNFDNQLERLQAVNLYQIVWCERTQRFVNIFPFGVAFLQAPFYGIGHFFMIQNWWNLNPDYFHQMQGVELPYSLWLMIGANVMALGAIILAWLIGQRICDNWTAMLISWAIFVGSPLFYYSTVSPLNSHNPGAFIASCFFYLLSICTGELRCHHNSPISPNRDLYKWIGLGLSAGLMVLVRWQLLLMVVPAWGLLIWQRRWKEVLLATLIAAIALLPLPIIWKRMFGQPFVVPYEVVYGRSFLELPTHSSLRWILIETPRNSPILLLSLIGIPFLWRIDRKWTILAIVAIGLQVLINGAALDWWGGETYGVRRMSELYPIYVLLACAILGKFPSKKHAQWFKWIMPITSRLLLIILILYSFLYILSFFSFTWTNPDDIHIAEPEVMISYFLNQSNRWEVIRALFRTHLGPPAWSKPGP
jgi:hypothetical protein